MQHPGVQADVPGQDPQQRRGHVRDILRAELPEFGCATPGAAFVVEGWEGESEATRELYAPGTGLLPQALRAITDSIPAARKRSPTCTPGCDTGRPTGR